MRNTHRHNHRVDRSDKVLFFFFSYKIHPHTREVGYSETSEEKERRTIEKML